MKRVFSILMLLILAACSSTKSPYNQPTESIANQKLVSNFERQKIKIEWDCVFGTGITDLTCIRVSIKAIEATAYATSFGNSEANREVAFSVAHDTALAKLSKFLQDDVNSTRVTKTISKNIERANDRVRTKSSTDNGSDPIEVSDTEASSSSEEVLNKHSNFNSRENYNEVVRTFTESIRTQTSGILRGVFVSDEQIVDRQTVSVTVRWDKDHGKAVKELRTLIR